MNTVAPITELFSVFSFCKVQLTSACERVAKLSLILANSNQQSTMSVPTVDIANILVDIYNQDLGVINGPSNVTAKVSRKRHNRDTDAVIGPLFHNISDTAAARLAAAAAMEEDNITEEGDRFATELSSLQKAVDVEPEMYVMWPAEDLDEGETLNGDTSADLNWVLAIIISITPAVTRARILGTLYSDATTFAGAFVKFGTPSGFIVPMGINRDAAREYGAKLGSTTESCTVSAEEQHEGASTTALKKTGETVARGYLDDLDGGRRLCRDMTQSSKRETILGPVWRLTKGRELEVAGRGNLLQVEEYLRCIWAAAIDPLLDSVGPFSGAPLIFQIATLKVTTEVATLTAFLQAKFGRGGSILLSDFRISPAVALQSKPTLQGRRQVAEDLSTLEMAMRVFYSDSFLDCFQQTRMALIGAADPLKLVPDDLLQHSVESCLERWGSSVRTERQSRSFPQLTMQTPSGCSILLSAMMDATVQSLCGDKVLLQDLHFRTYIKPALALTPRKCTTTPSAAGAKKEVTTPNASVICSYHVLAHFGVKNENGKLVVCTRGASCPKEHCNISTVAKADISAALKWLPANLREAALKKMRAKA